MSRNRNRSRNRILPALIGAGAGGGGGSPSVESLETVMTYRLDTTRGEESREDYLLTTYNGSTPSVDDANVGAAIGDINNVGDLGRWTDPSPPTPKRRDNEFVDAPGIEMITGGGLRSAESDGSSTNITPIADDVYAFGARVKLPASSGSGTHSYEADSAGRVAVNFIDQGAGLGWKIGAGHNDGGANDVVSDKVFSDFETVFVVVYYDGDEMHVWLNAATAETPVDVGDVASIGTGQPLWPSVAGTMLNAIFAGNAAPPNGIDDVQAQVNEWLARSGRNEDMMQLYKRVTYAMINAAGAIDSGDKLIELFDLPAGAVPVSLEVRCVEGHTDGGTIRMPLLVGKGDGSSLVPYNEHAALVGAAYGIDKEDKIHSDPLDSPLRSEVMALEAARTLYWCIRDNSTFPNADLDAMTDGEWDVILTYAPGDAITHTPAAKTSDIDNGAGYDTLDASMVVDDGGVFLPGDVVETPASELLLITAISGDTLTVVRGWLGSTPASLSDNDTLTLITDAP